MRDFAGWPLLAADSRRLSIGAAQTRCGYARSANRSNPAARPPFVLALTRWRSECGTPVSTHALWCYKLVAIRRRASMSRSHLSVALASLLLVLESASCYAQSQQPNAAPDAPSADACDCTRQVGTCRAAVIFKDRQLNVTSSSRQCSLVVFQVNGDSRTSTVMDGKATEQWLGDDITRLGVTSCSVCADNRK